MAETVQPLVKELTTLFMPFETIIPLRLFVTTTKNYGLTTGQASATTRKALP